MLLISAARVVPTLPTSATMLEQLRFWGPSPDNTQSAVSAQPSDPVATARAQCTAVDLFRTLWLRVASDSCTVADEEVQCMLNVALRSGLPSLIVDVAQHVVQLSGKVACSRENERLIKELHPQLEGAAQRAVEQLLSGAPVSSARPQCSGDMQLCLTFVWHA